MGHYKNNLRDLEFNLFEVFDRSELLGHGPYADVDTDTAREMVREVGRLASHELAESLLESDRTPPVYDPETYEVTLPEAFAKSYRAYMDAEWWRMDVPAELGERPAQGRRDDGAAELGGHVHPPPLGVHVGAVGLGEGLRQRDLVGLRVVHRRRAVGLQQRLGQLVGGEPADLAHHLAGGVGVDVRVGAVPEQLGAVEDLEEVELEVAEVVLVVAHGRTSPSAPGYPSVTHHATRQ